jgi:hypothetical protein
MKIYQLPSLVLTLINRKGLPRKDFNLLRNTLVLGRRRTSAQTDGQTVTAKIRDRTILTRPGRPSEPDTRGHLGPTYLLMVSQSLLIIPQCGTGWSNFKNGTVILGRSKTVRVRSGSANRSACQEREGKHAPRLHSARVFRVPHQSTPCGFLHRTGVENPALITQPDSEPVTASSCCADGPAVTAWVSPRRAGWPGLRGARDPSRRRPKM